LSNIHGGFCSFNFASQFSWLTGKLEMRQLNHAQITQQLLVVGHRGGKWSNIKASRLHYAATFWNDRSCGRFSEAAVKFQCGAQREERPNPLLQRQRRQLECGCVTPSHSPSIVGHLKDRSCIISPVTPCSRAAERLWSAVVVDEHCEARNE
jgi:hypothetical protein